MTDMGYTTVKDELAANGVYISNTSGTSMQPLLRHHRDVVVLSTPDRKIEKYDVVLYRGGSGKYILHRVISVKEDLLIIRGDNTYSKELVQPSEIIAVLTAFNRAGKRHTCDERGYLIYSRVWCAIYPLRLCVHLLRKALAKAYRVIFKRKNKNAKEGQNAPQ